MPDNGGVRRRARTGAVMVAARVLGAGSGGVAVPAAHAQPPPPVVDHFGAAAWGRNGSGQLGDGSLVNRPVPVDVSTLTSGVRQAAAGGAHSLALSASG